MTSFRDLCTWFLCNSTQFAELSQLNTSLRFCQKHNFFKAPKICNISTSRTTWLFPFTPSIFFDQPSVLLAWPFYNSKSFKPNASASLFGRRSRRLWVGLLVTLSELFTLPSQWPDLVVAKVFVETSHWLNVSSMNLLNKAPRALINNNGSCASAPIAACAHCFCRFSLQLRAIHKI